MPQELSQPLWADYPLPRFGTPDASREFDILIVGGGITGLSAAYFFKKAGYQVCVLERDRIGSGDTGHTTAHLTCVTDTRLSQLVKTFGRAGAALAWYGGNAAIDIIEHIVTEEAIDCQFQRVPAYLHASLTEQREESEELQSEAQLARELGFDADFVPEVPIVRRPGIRLANQALFHPLAYLAGLARFVDGDGSAIYEQCEANDTATDPLSVRCNDYELRGKYLVIATHVPLMGTSGLLKASVLQTRLSAYSTYVVGGRTPRDMQYPVSLWDTSDPYYYLRIDRDGDEQRVIFGGLDHKTGQETDSEARYAKLALLVKNILPDVEIDHRWSGQVIKANDGLPLIGETDNQQFVATGFNGNGITFGTLAGLMARDAFLEVENPWRDLLSVDRVKIRGGVWDYLRDNLDYPYYLLADLLSKGEQTAPREIRRGEGAVITLDGQRVACSRDANGVLHQLSPRCTHLGCIVRWNSTEQSWDCPCHGSRFRPTGEVIAGPAETPLPAVDVAATADGK